MEEKHNKQAFHARLQTLLDDLVHRIYDLTESFPKNEQFGLVSQLRRASLSVVLNYTEGFARQRSAVYKNFLEISYGSLKETKYLVEFCSKRNLIKEKDALFIGNLIEEAGKMLWGIIRSIKDELSHK